MESRDEQSARALALLEEEIAAVVDARDAAASDTPLPAARAPPAELDLVPGFDSQARDRRARARDANSKKRNVEFRESERSPLVS